MNEIEQLASLTDRTTIEDVAIDIAILVDDRYPGTYDYVLASASGILQSMYANVHTCQTQDIVVQCTRGMYLTPSYFGVYANTYTVLTTQCRGE